jgi:enamine deaminase RidA (YjgF/YER057c/UK114 family)
MTRPIFASPPDLLVPAGYSHVVTIPPGQLAWTAGQVPMTRERQIPEGWEAQTRLAFQNTGRALRAAGAAWADVVKLTIYVVELTELPLIRRIRDEFVDTDAPPTSSLVQVAALFDPNVLLEVEAVAFLPALT